MTVDERQDAWAALRMISEAVEELFSPIASLESEDATLLRGPEYHHRAEGIIEALQRTAAEIVRLRDELRGSNAWADTLSRLRVGICSHYP